MWILILTLLIIVTLMSYGGTLSQFFSKIGINYPQEDFETYKMKPFNYYSTGSDPLYFYQLKQYRLPYDYPRTFYKSYPVEHNAHFEMASGP